MVRTTQARKRFLFVPNKLFPWDLAELITYYASKHLTTEYQENRQSKSVLWTKHFRKHCQDAKHREIVS